jgi:hypothetical protein
MTFCRVRNLLPGKHVIFSLRSSKEWDEAAQAKVPVTKIIFMTTIDASRLIAERTKLYNGQAPEQYIYLDDSGSPSIVSEIPLPQLPLPPKGTAALPREPWAVKTTVYRKDFSQPVSSVARFDAYAAVYNTKEGPKLNEMWARRGPEQLSKCSEMLSLRKAFPEELGGIYLAEEFKPDPDEVAAQPISPAVAVPLPPTVPPVNQEPAKGTDTPRPHEPTSEEKNFDKKLAAVVASEESEEERKDLAEALTKARTAVPGLKPASEIPEPAKKRGGRPKKETPVSPENGQPAAVSTEPGPEFDVTAPTVAVKETNEQEAREFVDSVTNFTEAEAAAAGLPEPPEYSLIPEKGSEQMKGFTARVRALSSAGALNADLKNYILAVGQKSETDKLTVRDWKTALDQLESAQKEGKLKEVTKNVPLPDKF